MSSRIKDTLQRANRFQRPGRTLFSKPKLPDPRVIYIIGGPSSGKTSIATMLAEEYSILHLIPSEVAGQVALAGSDEDKKFVEKKINADTKELPDDALCKLLRKVMHQSIQNDITWFILEGVPASIDQFRRFDKEFGHKLIIYVNTSSDEMEKRRMALEMTFIDGGERKKDLDDRRKSFYTNLTNMQNDHTFPRMHWVQGEKPVTDIIKELRPIMDNLLHIKKRTKSESNE